MNALKTGRPIERLNAWLVLVVRMTGLSERDVLDRVLEVETSRASAARCTDTAPWFVFAWANDQRINLVFNGAIAS